MTTQHTHNAAWPHIPKQTQKLPPFFLISETDTVTIDTFMTNNIYCKTRHHHTVRFLFGRAMTNFLVGWLVVEDKIMVSAKSPSYSMRFLFVGSNHWQVRRSKRRTFDELNFRHPVVFYGIKKVFNYRLHHFTKPVAVAARSKAWVCGR